MVSYKILFITPPNFCFSLSLQEMDQQNLELRSKLLDESKKTILAEMAAKTDAELVAKELKLEKDSLEKKYQEAMSQISELNQMKERYSHKMHETMAQ